MIIDGVEYIGISNDLFKDLKYFNQVFFSNSIFLDFNNPDITDLVSVSVDIENKILELLETPVRRSNEGKKMLGKKLLIELKFNYKIKYLSHNVNEKNIYFLNKSLTKSNYLILPKKINNKSVEELNSKNAFVIESYIEYIYAKIKNNKEIIINTSFILNGKIKNLLHHINSDIY